MLVIEMEFVFVFDFQWRAYFSYFSFISYFSPLFSVPPSVFFFFSMV